MAFKLSRRGMKHLVQYWTTPLHVLCVQDSGPDGSCTCRISLQAISLCHISVLITSIQPSRRQTGVHSLTLWAYGQKTCGIALLLSMTSTKRHPGCVEFSCTERDTVAMKLGASSTCTKKQAAADMSAGNLRRVVFWVPVTDSPYKNAPPTVSNMIRPQSISPYETRTDH